MTGIRRDERGFSLTEVMIVVLIIAILIGIALPTYLGMRRRAQEVAAKDSLVVALKVAKSFTADDDTFAAVSTAALEDAEPSLQFVDGGQPSTGPLLVSQTVPDAGAGDEIFVAAARSVSGACFYVRAFSQAGVDYGRVDGADCRADDHATVIFGPSW